MELQVTQENFSKALAGVGRVANNKTQLPILSNILLRTDNGQLLVAATNLEMASTYRIGAKIAKEGAITIPARLVHEFVSNLPKEQVALVVKNDKLHISCGTYNSIINGVVADEFPELPVIDESIAVRYSLVTDHFKQAISQTIVTTSSDTTRPILTGVYWHSHDGSLYLASTDGYRLSEKRLIETKSDIAAIIPTTSLQEVLRTLSDDLEEIDILFDDTQVHFRMNEVEITSRLIDGVFPDYRQLIPTGEQQTSITLKKSDFVRVTKIASLFARESGGGVTLRVDEEGKSLQVHSIASEIGENTSEAPVISVKGGGVITLNSRYLTEALAVVDGDEVTFTFNDKIAPSVLMNTIPDTDYKHIIMPLKS